MHCSKALNFFIDNQQIKSSFSQFLVKFLFSSIVNLCAQNHSKSITPLDDYEFTLSNELKTFVEKEFRETDETRKHAIESLREWAAQNPRINKLRLDSNFLLRFLRCKKFSLPMTKEAIERYLVLRWYNYEGAFIFHNLDEKLPEMQELLDLG